MKKYMMIIFAFAVFNFCFAQENEMITVIGDSLVGKVINGEAVREVYGNVILSQGNVTITCNQAIQFISRNDAELIGNVIAKQDSLTIKTPKGYYFGNEQKTKSISGVVLDDQKVILSADSGEYFFDIDEAFFQTNVRLYDTVSTLTSNELTYYQKEDRALAIGNVKIVDKKNIIKADTLEHFRKMEITYAFGNVSISDSSNNSIIYGQHLEDYRNTNYSFIDKLPLFVQIDTSKITNEEGQEELRFDTLFITSKIMEAYRDSSERFYAIDSVQIIRDGFSSKNDLTIYFKDKERIVTSKQSNEGKQPVLWQENSQLTGDSITIHLDANRIIQLDVDGKAFMLSQNKNFLHRFDQTSSSSTKIFFNDNKISRTEFYENVYSIYYLYEEEEPNGLIKSNSKSTTIFFEDNEVNEVKLYGLPSSEYYPEQQVDGNEKTYLLPRFIFIENKPTKQDMYKLIPKK